MENIFGLILILITILSSQGYQQFGKDCGDISCEPGQRCIIYEVHCNNTQDMKRLLCGKYPECQTDQPGRDFTIDTTLTIANTRSSIIIPSTSTTRNQKPKDTDFELLTDFSNPNPLATHAGQRQTNVLVIVQDGSQQPQQPNPWLNPGQSPPCQVSPLYPYACNYPSYGLNPGMGLPTYPQARAANRPQLVPPTPPCYYNCYPARTGASSYSQYGYPLARSASPASMNNNYLMYLTLAG
ncbi:uncharacterized protein [Drosophila bipectinata]|uniref:uncharacterized protein n=1 Tax=Drosophila bipectinata TaxID=42026 RepID=UPI001C8AE21F|nr:uncharacterized protein LOC108128294 [Drosophila bipectinata]